MKKYYIVSLVFILLLAIVPAALFLLANFITGLVRCPAIADHNYICVIHGHDYGEGLSIIGSPLLATLALILAAFMFILWVITLAIHLLMHRFRGRAKRQT
jgi:hypothetical protein